MEAERLKALADDGYWARLIDKARGGCISFLLQGEERYTPIFMPLFYTNPHLGVENVL